MSNETQDQLMVSFGTNCKEAGHQLQTISMQTLYQYIKNGDQGLIKQTKTLRTVRRYSPDRYRTMKTTLPFFSCSLFDPPQRKKENFVHAMGCILDIDWKTEPDWDGYTLVRNDPRIALSYISPSRAGAKLVFLFDEVITDANKYSMLYKRFIHRFAYDYRITDVVDFRNSDVSRISFICHDSDAAYNPQALKIFTGEFLEEPSLTPSMSDTNTTSPPVRQQQDIPPDVYQSILAKLGTRSKAPRNTVPVRGVFRHVLPLIRETLASYDIDIIEATGIQYGIKLRIKLGNDVGEVNIYHGHRGFSVVSSPKKGTKYELNEVARHIILSVLPIV